MNLSIVTKKYTQYELDTAYIERVEYIAHEINKDKDNIISLLDIGCGRGLYIKLADEILDGCNIVGFDVDQKNIDIAKNTFKFTNKNKIRIEQKDFLKDKINENSFDIVILSEVLEHLEDDKLVLSKIRELSKPEGTLIITVPSSKFPFTFDPINFVLKFFNTHIDKNNKYFGGIWTYHERLYKEKEFHELIESSGFEIINSRRSISHFLPFTHLLIYGIGKNIIENFSAFKNQNRFDYANGKKPMIFIRFIAWMLQTYDKLNIIDKRRPRYLGLFVKAKKDT